MSSKRLDAISDYRRQRYSLRIDCRSCERVVIVVPQLIIDFCERRRWSRQMDFVERRLRCCKCGARSVRCGPSFVTPRVELRAGFGPSAEWQVLANKRPKLRFGFQVALVGYSVAQWGGKIR